MTNKDFLNKIIYVKRGSIPDILCDDIIKRFESICDEHQDGRILSGVDKEIKDTKDFVIPKNNKYWKDIEHFLYNELYRNLKEYSNILTIKDESIGYIKKYITNAGHISTNLFLIQKYIKNEGKYIYHHDHTIEGEQQRIITFLWYLNDVNDGGETEFFGNYRIKPEKGKLILFPASWCFPHCGLMPKSSNKYIITGWIYQKI